MEEMNPRTARRTGGPAEGQIDSDAREYLMNLQCLSRELQRAMEAIVSRELAALQDSVRVQRSMCARLRDLQQSAKVRELLKSPPCSPGGELSAEIEAATEVLLVRNRQYSALLTHAGETLRLLAGLYRGYLHPYQGHPHPGHRGHARIAAPTARNSWHCEI